MNERQPLPGRSTEVDFLGQVGFWFVDSVEAKTHAPRIKKFKALGFVGMRRHRRTNGQITDAYELTDQGLARLEAVAGIEAANTARGSREYLRTQARKAE